MSKFIGYTNGFLASNGSTSKLVQAEYSRNSDGSVDVKAVSARTLAATTGSAKITAEEFSDRPQDAYDSVKEARWALKLCGWSLDSAKEE